MEKYQLDGKIAVLYSPGYGAGWSTWADDRETEEKAIFCPEIVKIILAEQRVTEEDAKKYLGNDFYASGADQLKIEWMDPGTRFEIEEYDGHESIKYLDKTPFFTA